MKIFPAVAVATFTVATAAPAQPVLNNEKDTGAQGQSSASGSAGVENAEKAAAETGPTGDNNTTINTPAGTRKQHRAGTRRAVRDTAGGNANGAYQSSGQATPHH